MVAKAEAGSRRPSPAVARASVVGCPHCDDEGGVWVMGVEYVVLRIPCSCRAGDRSRRQTSPDIFSLIGEMLTRLRTTAH